MHEFIMFFSSREFFTLMKDLSINFNFFMFISKIKMLTSCLCHTLLTIQLLNTLQSPLMTLIVMLDTVQLHYPHAFYI